MANTPFLPYGRQHIDDEDVDAVVAALRSDFLTTGPAVTDFEAAFAKKVGADHAVVCNSGTAALHLAALALGLGQDDVVIVPSQTFLATASAPHLTGAEVVFADCDPETGLMRAEDLEQAIEQAKEAFPGKQLRAVFPVHLTGMSVDMRAIAQVAERAGLVVIEDACHALGGLTYRTGQLPGVETDLPVGNCHFSKASVFSCHPVKNLAMGEGGVVTTNDAAFAERLRTFRNHGMQRSPEEWQNPDRALSDEGETAGWFYEMAMPGFNYRAPDILCALGLSQLEKLERFTDRRSQLAQVYLEHLDGISNAVHAPLVADRGRHGWHLMAVRIDFDELGISRQTLTRLLRDQQVGSQVHYIPVHSQPYWEKRYGRNALPGAEQYYARTLSLPLFVDMTETDVTRVIDALSVAVKG